MKSDLQEVSYALFVGYDFGFIGLRHPSLGLCHRLIGRLYYWVAPRRLLCRFTFKTALPVSNNCYFAGPMALLSIDLAMFRSRKPNLLVQLPYYSWGAVANFPHSF